MHSFKKFSIFDGYFFNKKYARFHFSLLKWIEEDVAGFNNMGCAIVVLFGNAMKFYSLDAGYPGIGFLQSCSVIEDFDIGRSLGNDRKRARASSPKQPRE